MHKGARLILFLIAYAIMFGPKNLLAQKSPEEELASMKPADEFEVSLFAAEPMITNPSAIDVDTHGRVWVAEIQWYRGAAKDPPADKIKVVEDSDGDGKADKVTVFAEGLFCPMSVCVAGDKVYVATSPDLWVYEDKDGDLKADGPPTKLLTGFGGRNHDHGAHSLVLGPDHKWWMSHGDRGFDVTGVDGSHIKYQWGAMLRGELDGSKLETVAVNFRNPYELCVSSFGEAYCSDNDNDGNQSVRICWILEGGNYGWYGGPPERAPEGTPFGEHWHFRGHIPGHVPATLVTGFGSPCGMCFYEGDAFGFKYKNAVLHTDPGPREVRRYVHTNEGAGKKAFAVVFLTADDPYFRPDDICAAPDGSLYVSDWYDGGVGGHAYNNPDQGRIVLLRPKGVKLHRREKPGPYVNLADAIEGLKSPNLATQFLARERLLAEGEKCIPALRDLLSDPEPNFRARSLWMLDRIDGPGRELVLDQLASKDNAMRALAVRILRRHGDRYTEPILKLVNDSSSEVIREVLLTLRYGKGDQVAQVIANLALRYDGGDRYLLETINIVAADHKQEVYDRLTQHRDLTLAQFDLLQLLNPQAAGERLTKELTSGAADAAIQALLTSAGTIGAPEVGRTVLAFLANEQVSPPLREFALRRLSANLGGSWRTLADDEQLLRSFRILLADRFLQRPALQVIADRRLQVLAADVLALAAAIDADHGVRCAAITAAAQLSTTDCSVALRNLLDDPIAIVREAALTALVDLQDVQTVRDILAGSDDKFTAAVRAAVADRMVASTGGALALLKLIEDDRLSSEIRGKVIDKATQHPDANVRVLYEQFTPADQRPKRLGQAISADEILKLTGDAKRGQEIFTRSSAAQCNHCHEIHDRGVPLGPKLTLIGKKYERAALLETILQPSKAISHEYVVHVAETVDGRVLAGFIVEKTDQQLALRDAQSQLHRIPAGEVESLTPQPTSMMPELVLRDITAQDAADLLAYLMTLK